MSSPRLNDFPALTGECVTEAHARICAEPGRGHATHTRNGVDTGVCPRCGEVTEAPRTSYTHAFEHDGSSITVEFGVNCDGVVVADVHGTGSVRVYVESDLVLGGDE